MGIRTIHIENNVPKLCALAKELYDHTLKDDPNFHFFFEPALIIRITTKDSLTKVKNFFQSKKIKFEEYNYPFPPEGKFGEESGGFVAITLLSFYQYFMQIRLQH